MHFILEKNWKKRIRKTNSEYEINYKYYLDVLVAFKLSNLKNDFPYI